MAEDHRCYRVIRMQSGPYNGGDRVWGVLDIKYGIVAYTSYSQLLAEDECNRLNGFRSAAQCAS